MGAKVMVCVAVLIVMPLDGDVLAAKLPVAA
jgi:hypothetical protein